MWQKIKDLIVKSLGDKALPEDEDGGDSGGDLGDLGDPKAEAPAPILFHRYYKYMELFSFNVPKLDINLLIYPDSGDAADRDAVLLLVFGCEEILGLDDVNEAYICRKLGETRDRWSARGQTSFETVLSQTRAFDAQAVTDACVACGDVERISVVAGGSLRLTVDALARTRAMADDLNRRATT